MKFRYLYISLLALCCTFCTPGSEQDPSLEPSAEPVSADPSSEPEASEDSSSEPEASEEPHVPSSECELLGMTFLSGEDRIEAEVDAETRKVSFEYGYHQRAGLRSGTAIPEMSEGAKMTPDPSVTQDWLKKGLQVRVTAEDGKTFKKYSITSTALPAPRPKKPLVLWIDAANSYGLLSTPEKVEETVQKVYDGGFTGIVVEVKAPQSGDVLYYKSDVLGYAVTLEGGKTVNQDFDLLQAFIDACHKRDMTLTVSYCIFTFPEPTSAKSRAYYQEHFDEDAYCRQLLTTGIEDIRINPADYWFLNPVHPAVHEYVEAVVKEIVTNYDIDGFALDYCRYPNIRSDFSDYSRAAFEEYIGHPVDNWPSSIMTVANDSNMGSYNVGDNTLFRQWMAWRAYVIQGYVKNIRDIIKAIKPSVALEAWAACWYQYRNETGQNWGSYQADWASKHYSWASAEYDKAGYAEYLDIFHLGNYVKTIYGKSESSWSMEYFTSLAKSVIAGACTLYNSFGLYTGISADEATYYSYLNYDGIMIFELGSMEGGKQYDNVMSGYARAMYELGELD